MSIWVFALPLLLLLAAPVLHAQVLLNDDFSSGTSGPLPTGASAEWFLNGTGGSATYTQGSPGSLAQNFFGESQSVNAYFTAPTSAITLNVGETLAASFSFTMAGAADSSDGIRVALLNSNNNQISANTDVTDPAFTNYTGYAAFFNPNNTSGGGLSTNLYSRAAGGGNDNLITANTAYTTLGVPTFTGSALTIGAGTYSGVLSLTYVTSGTMLVAFSMTDPSSNQATYSFLTPTISTTSFDTLVIGGIDNAATSMTLNNVMVLATVPEPPVYALCGGGLAVLALAGWWSRRRAARMTA
ncbi:MAG TPA: hypothetical protein VK717_08760 [Opitutaceae bacterium]|nr:hypothetical protein [Opitutaceae bacterium]